MPDVVPQDIRNAAYGTKIPEGADVDEQLDGLIAKAGREIARKVPNLAARLAAGRVTETDVRDVIEAMVVRVVRNPSGYRQIGIDDFQATVDSALSTGALRLTDDEHLALAGPRKTRRFGTARLYMPAHRLP